MSEPTGPSGKNTQLKEGVSIHKKQGTHKSKKKKHCIHKKMREKKNNTPAENNQTPSNQQIKEEWRTTESTGTQGFKWQ